jgi:hypothetical protein
METISWVVPPATITAVVEEAGVRERRVRKQTASVTILGLIEMALYSHLSMSAVIQKLAKGLRLLWTDWKYPVANASALAQRRYQLMVRVIEHTFTDPHRPGSHRRHRLFTTLLDPHLYPALDLVCAYHERWEVALVIDEVQVHQRLVNHPLRSLKPRGVIQELYAILLAHYVVRAYMHEAALDADVTPDRLSFVGALRIVQDALIEFQLADPSCHAALLSRLLHDLARERLPEHRNRINPRVVKRTAIRFPRKRAEHVHPPQLSCSFCASVALI